MRVPISWLNDYVNVNDLVPQQLADKLVSIGFEVEEIIYRGADLQDVVVGRIEQIERHPNADKLQICDVNVGRHVTIITGAKNIKIGDYVPVALDGAVLPGGKKIVASPLRDIMSYGMMCSGAELGVDNHVIEGAEVDGILILPTDSVIGEKIVKALRMDDYILDISITANRPDCQSIYGIAREIGAVLGRKVKAPKTNYNTVNYKGEYMPDVLIEAEEVCTRYTGSLVRDVKVEKSPQWMKDRLLMCGVRPINNIVDITNYVLLEIGQPLHAFDISVIDKSIVVRYAREEESIVALDGNEYNLKQNMLVISDINKPLAIAGVMGGEYSGINSGTKSVFLESARFAKGNVRTTSKALGLRSASSARYEKGVDYYSIEYGRERALYLFNKLKVGKIVDIKVIRGNDLPRQKIITTSVEQINSLLGIKIPRRTIVRILNSLEIKTTIEGNKLQCMVPMFREDIDNYTDIVEEVIRFYGYNNLNEAMMNSSNVTLGGDSIEHKRINDIKQLAVGYGMYEILNYSFINPKLLDMICLSAEDYRRKFISIANPLSEDFVAMRTQLVASMLSTVQTNLMRKNDNFRLFEQSKIFLPDSLPLSKLPDEREHFSFCFVGKNESFYEVKAFITYILSQFGIEFAIDFSHEPYLHPGISADIIVNNQIIGSFGKVHPTVMKNFDISGNVFIGEIDLTELVSTKQAAVKYIALPKYPSVERDIALVVDERLTVGELKSCICSECKDIFEKIEMFDIYRGEQIGYGKKSIAFRITLRSKEKTLVDSEIQATMTRIMNALSSKYGAQLRS